MSANGKELCHPRGNYLSHLHAQPPNPDVKVEDSLLSIFIERVGFDKILSFKVKMNKKKMIIIKTINGLCHRINKGKRLSKPVTWAAHWFIKRLIMGST